MYRKTIALISCALLLPYRTHYPYDSSAVHLTDGAPQPLQRSVYHATYILYANKVSARMYVCVCLCTSIQTQTRHLGNDRIYYTPRRTQTTQSPCSLRDHRDAPKGSGRSATITNARSQTLGAQRMQRHRTPRFAGVCVCACQLVSNPSRRENIATRHPGRIASCDGPLPGNLVHPTQSPGRYTPPHIEEHTWGIYT